MKINPRKLTKKETVKTLDALYTAASSVKGRAAVKLFLRDLLTESERIMLGRRIIIAKKLLSGESYLAIQRELGVGKDTITRVHRWLTDHMPGYEQAIKGMEREFGARRTRAEIAGNFAKLKRNYPLHFLLFPWPKGFKPRK